jgi:GT2 family glycosyltransferase
LTEGVALRVSICVGSIRAKTVGFLVDSIVSQTYPDWELIVAAQGQAVGFMADLDRIERLDERVRVLHLLEFGRSRALNAAITVATGEVLAFTDDDCEADPGWLDGIVEAFRGSTSVGLVGGAVIAPTRDRRGFASCPSFTPREVLFDPTESFGSPPPGFGWIGANFAVRRDVVARIGAFDAYLGVGTNFPAAEDTDYALRLERAGVQMFSTPTVRVTHSFGYRYGLRAMLRSQRAYARGNGALGAKLTLLGDKRVSEWVSTTSRRRWSQWRRPDRVVESALHHRHFMSGYRDCLANFEVAQDSMLLRPRTPR